MCEENILKARRAFADKVENEGLYYAACEYGDMPDGEDTELRELLDAFYLDGQQIERLLEESAKLKPFRDIK